MANKLLVILLPFTLVSCDSETEIDSIIEVIPHLDRFENTMTLECKASTTTQTMMDLDLLTRCNEMSLSVLNELQNSGTNISMVSEHPFDNDSIVK